jgi:hypothetical protein
MFQMFQMFHETRGETSQGTGDKCIKMYQTVSDWNGYMGFPPSPASLSWGNVAFFYSHAELSSQGRLLFFLIKLVQSPPVDYNDISH